MNNNSGLVPALLNAILTTQEHEITCSECFDLMDQYAEVLLSGESAGAVLPAVSHHLAHCPDCDEECQALLAMLQIIEEDSETPPPDSPPGWLNWLTSLRRWWGNRWNGRPLIAAVVA